MPNKNFTGQVVGLVALAAAGLLWMGLGSGNQGGEVRIASGEVREGSGAGSGPPVEELIVGEAASSGERDELAATPGTSAAAVSDGEPPAAGARVVALAGRAFWADGEPDAGGPVSGALTVDVGLGGGSLEFTLDVVDGEIAFEVLRQEDGSYTSLDEAEALGNLDGSLVEYSVSDFRDALEQPGIHCEADREPVDVDLLASGRFGSTDQVLYFRRLQPVVLRVVDRLTKVDLSAVQLLGAGDWGYVNFAHPLGQEIKPRVETIASPMALQPRSYEALWRGQVFLVGAEGYGWEQVELNLSDGGSQVVELGPAGSLEVVLEGPLGGESLARGAVVRIRRDEQWEVFHERAASTSGPYRLDAVPVGTYTASVEIGESWRDITRLGEAKGAVEEGGVTVLRVLVEAPPVVPMAMVAGDLWIDPAWGLNQFHLSFQALQPRRARPEATVVLSMEELVAVEGAPGHYSFACGPLEVGDWIAEVSAPEFDWKVVFEVPEAGLTDLQLLLPGPVEVTADVVEDTTGEPLRLETLHWHCAWPERSGGGTLGEVGRGSLTEPFRLRVPEGAICFDTLDIDLSAGSRSYEAREGAHLEVRLEQLTTCVLEFVSGGVFVPVPDDYHADPKPFEGEGWSNTDGGVGLGKCRFGVTEPGRYRLELPSFPGYAPLDPIEIELPARMTTTVRVELTPVD